MYVGKVVPSCQVGRNMGRAVEVVFSIYLVPYLTLLIGYLAWVASMQEAVSY